MSELEKVFQKIDGYRDEIIDLQAGLTSRIAVGPSSGGPGESEKAEYLKQRIEELDPDRIEEVNAPDERVEKGYRPNLIAQWNGQEGSPTVWLLSHLDIVPPGDPSLWNSDPYKIEVDGDKIVGRGVEDNQQGIVSSFFAIKAIKDTGVSLKRPVGMIFVSDEETGNKYGLDYLLKNRMDYFKAEDLIIVPDAGNEEGTMIEVAEKSLLHLKLTVTGKQCHASTPSKGKNSLFGAAKLIVALEELKMKFDLNDDIFSPPVSTFEPTKIEANVPNVNTIPGKDVFYMDCRVLPSQGLDEVLSEMNRIVEGIGRELDLSIEVEPLLKLEASNPTPKDSQIVQELKASIKKISGVDGEPMGIGGGTVAALFRREGLPAAVWMTTSDTAHQPNEYCLISNIITDAKVFSSIFMDEFNAR